MKVYFKSKKQLKWIPVWYLAIAIMAFLPMLIVVLGDFIGKQAGCKINEGFINDCVWHGLHIGAPLTNMLVIGWFILLTIPLGAVAAIIITIVSIHDIAYHYRKQ